MELTVSFNPSDLVGHEFPNGVRLIAAPAWNEKSQKWNALADVGGAMCIVELTLRIKGKKEG